MTYDYVCTACSHAWEAEQRISEPALTDCPECHQASAKRQISGGLGFILKGGGWYSDLYSSAKPPTDSAKESKSETKTESKSETKTESKPETKTESKPEKSASPSANSASGTSASPATS